MEGLKGRTLSILQVWNLLLRPSFERRYPPAFWHPDLEVAWGTGSISEILSAQKSPLLAPYVGLGT